MVYRSGSGYLTACMAYMVSPGGLAVGVEHIAELRDQSELNVRKASSVICLSLTPFSMHETVYSSPQADAALLDDGSLQLHACDGFSGYPAAGPYNCIHIGAAAPSVESLHKLFDQLAPGGMNQTSTRMLPSCCQ